MSHHPTPHIPRTIMHPIWGLVRCVLGMTMIIGFVLCAYSVEKGLGVVIGASGLMLLALLCKVGGLFPSREVVLFRAEQRVVVVDNSLERLDPENIQDPPVSTLTIAQQPLRYSEI